MKVGAEPKRVVVLVSLSALAGYLLYRNVISGPGAGTGTNPPPARQAASVVQEVARGGPRVEAARPRTRRLQEFRPSLRARREVGSGAEGLQPKLQTELLARVRSVTLEGGRRNLFEFGPAPLPPKPEPKILPKPVVASNPTPAPPPDAGKPKAPPIPLKFYGFTAPVPDGPKKAFFLDGDEILMGGEGEILKRRYRVVRIGVNSVVVEDLQFNSEQTLPLEPQTG